MTPSKIKHLYSGLFITFEGTDGSGKSTLMRHLVKHFKSHRISYLITREPGGPKVAEKIRKILVSENMDPWTELFLYEASRSEHVMQTVLPALRKGKVVLCDRYADSSLAYQAHARRLPWKQVHQLNQLATRGLTPDLTFFLDVNPDIALKRATHQNRFEREGLLFQKKVRNGFLRAMKQSPRRWKRIRVTHHSPEDIAKEALDRLKPLFIQKKLGKIGK